MYSYHLNLKTKRYRARYILATRYQVPEVRLDNDTLSSYLRCIETIRPDNENVFPQIPMVFRGQANTQWPLSPTLFWRYKRWGGGQFKSLHEVEERVHRHFEMNAEIFGISREDEVKFQHTARHHGVPSSLLDVTYDPFFALWAASSDETLMNEDGAVFIIDCLADFDGWMVPPKGTARNKEFKTSECILLPHLEKPVVNHQRIAAQKSAFIRFNVSPLYKIFTSLEDWISDLEERRAEAEPDKGSLTAIKQNYHKVHTIGTMQPARVFKVVIPAKFKQNLNQWLMSLGGGEGKYFADADAVARELHSDRYMIPGRVSEFPRFR